MIPAEEMKLLNGLDLNLPNTALNLFVYKLAKIRSTAPKAYQNLDLFHEPTQRELKIWFDEAVSLDNELQTWAETVIEKFPTYQYKELINDPAAQPEIIHIYHNIFIASVWCFYRCSRLILLLDLIDYEARFRRAAITPFASADHQQQQQPKSAGWQATITTMVDEICASVPFLLGDLDAGGNLQCGAGRMALGGMFLLWPLQVIGVADVMSRTQRVWIKEILRQMGYTMGIKQAITLRDRL